MTQPHLVELLCLSYFNDSIDGVIEKQMAQFNIKNKRIKSQSLGYICYIVSCYLYDIVIIADCNVNEELVFNMVEYRVKKYITNNYRVASNNNKYNRLLNDINVCMNNREHD